MFIYFRACEKQATISNVVRFKNTAKTEILKKCWLSIQASVTPEDTIIVIHDEVSQETLDWMDETRKTINMSLVKVPEHEWGNHLHTIVLISVLEELCTQYPDELHYIVEDDYLHTPNAIKVLSSNLAGWENFATSYDYPDRYSMVTPCRVILGLDRHWRTIESSTMTLLAKGSTWLKVMDNLKEAAPTSNDRIFNEIFKTIPCISPMPGVSSHMTDYHSTPLVDWDSLFGSYMIKPINFPHLASFKSKEGYLIDESCLLIIRDILEITKAKTMLEIGFNIGYSAAMWLQEGITTFHVIDIGYHEDTLPALRATKEFYSNKNIYWNILDSKSEKAHELVIPDLELVFIDGDHSFKGIINDIKLAKKLNTTWIVVDDYVRPNLNGIFETVNEELDSGKLSLIKKYELDWQGQGSILLCKVNK